MFLRYATEMAKVQLQVWGFRCERCGHEWIPRHRDEEPRVCPKCKSPYWNRPRKVVRAESVESSGGNGLDGKEADGSHTEEKLT